MSSSVSAWQGVVSLGGSRPALHLPGHRSQEFILPPGHRVSCPAGCVGTAVFLLETPGDSSSPCFLQLREAVHSPWPAASGQQCQDSDVCFCDASSSLRFSHGDPCDAWACPGNPGSSPIPSAPWESAFCLHSWSRRPPGSRATAVCPAVCLASPCSSLLASTRRHGTCWHRVFMARVQQLELHVLLRPSPTGVGCWVLVSGDSCGVLLGLGDSGLGQPQQSTTGHAASTTDIRSHGLSAAGWGRPLQAAVVLPQLCVIFPPSAVCAPGVGLGPP